MNTFNYKEVNNIRRFFTFKNQQMDAFAMQENANALKNKRESSRLKNRKKSNKNEIKKPKNGFKTKEIEDQPEIYAINNLNEMKAEPIVLETLTLNGINDFETKVELISLENYEKMYSFDNVNGIKIFDKQLESVEQSVVLATQNSMKEIGTQVEKPTVLYTFDALEGINYCQTQPKSDKVEARTELVAPAKQDEAKALENKKETKALKTRIIIKDGETKRGAQRNKKQSRTAAKKKAQKEWVDFKSQHMYKNKDFDKQAEPADLKKRYIQNLYTFERQFEMVDIDKQEKMIIFETPEQLPGEETRVAAQTANDLEDSKAPEACKELTHTSRSQSIIDSYAALKNRAAFEENKNKNQFGVPKPDISIEATALKAPQTNCSELQRVPINGVRLATTAPNEKRFSYFQRVTIFNALQKQCLQQGLQNDVDDDIVEAILIGLETYMQHVTKRVIELCEYRNGFQLYSDKRYMYRNDSRITMMFLNDLHMLDYSSSDESQAILSRRNLTHLKRPIEVPKETINATALKCLKKLQRPEEAKRSRHSIRNIPIARYPQTLEIPRSKRICLQDVLQFMEQHKCYKQSDLLVEAYLKNSY